MAGDYAALQTAWETIIAGITSTLQKEKAKIILDQYILALKQQASAAKSNVSSYSAAGVSISRTQQDNSIRTAERLEAELNSICYGSVTYSDIRGEYVAY